MSSAQGFSRRALTAIRIAEARDLWPGCVGEGLDAFRRFLRRPGRWLYIPWADCPCCDPVYARDELEIALRRLPAHARAELRRALAPLDDEFRRRTLPDPGARFISAWHADAWWRQRLHE